MPISCLMTSLSYVGDGLLLMPGTPLAVPDLERTRKSAGYRCLISPGYSMSSRAFDRHSIVHQYTPRGYGLPKLLAFRVPQRDSPTL